ncbi:glycerophosphoryl diester phosphodiesterase [Gillisia sp. Hel_I_86]|uniref:glycerophosphodiester phosphodiesterase n=1 Tax=Gillisia sp. Hel_I_86 TaxID=1249981 RepID=UPI00119A692B|nr:glycerophosphodiester phosphodiesterase family protein [Gillisia sp. Hel_I_86]TVZ26671.1 glycerophosphoryl diester phosphodiesterase [Gillisia sp. Hel_I_86]
MNPIYKIGHRGAKGHITENTLESINLALEMGVDGIEIDVHVCASGELVVFHDFALDRLTDGSGEVTVKTYGQLQQLKLKGGYKIPLLTEVLDLIEGKCSVNIELKGLHTAKPTCAIISKYINKGWDYNSILVSSFQENELLEAKKINANILIAVLSKASVEEAIEWAKILNATAIHPSLGIITRQSVIDAHNKGFNVNVWTVNEPEDIARMIEFGVDGIISDYPDRLISIIGESLEE